MAEDRGKFYHLVPKGVVNNAVFRKRLIAAGCESRDRADEMIRMCREDILFWVNSFLFTYDPRKTPSVLPFVTWEYQDHAILKLVSLIGKRDCLIEKSRDMGASWMCLLVFFHRWLFMELETFLLVSRKEQYVEKTGDPKALFWKFDFMLERLPTWMTPRYRKRKMHRSNVVNGCTIDGESTTSDVARGDRRTAIMLDEFSAFTDGYAALSATRDATRCRLFNSTPKGQCNAFYDMTVKVPDKIRMHWSQHPEKSKGLYLDDKGLQRSPWYDAECLRMANDVERAQELDISYSGSDYRFFDEMTLGKVLDRDVMPPFDVGNIQFDSHTGYHPYFSSQEDGPVLLWTRLDASGNPPSDRQYSMGIDVSTGIGSSGNESDRASNSCISVVDMNTGEKVCEIAVAGMQPHLFAILAVSTGRWFTGPDGTGAFMIWEGNGIGVVFGNAVIDMGYRNIYYRRREKRISRQVTDEPGWWSGVEAKIALLGDYRRALQDGLFTNRSKRALDECRYYIHTANGRVEHARSVRSADPTGARENHGDRVIADALAYKGLREMTSGVPILGDAVQDGPPVGSFSWRRELSRKTALSW